MLQKGFLRDKYKIRFSKRRFWMSVILGLGAAFGIYVFFCVFRLIFRIMDFDVGNGPLIYGESSRYRQNINLAILSLVLGNSIFLGTLFKISSKSNLPSYKRISIQNNQSFLGFGFFALFAQCFFIAGIITSEIFDPMLFSINAPLFVLIALVLFLENWITIIRLFRGRALKKMIINMGVLVVLTMLLSTTSIFDYKKMDAVMLAQNPTVDLPESYFKSVPNWYLGKTIKLIHEEDDVRYQVNGKFMNFKELKANLRNEKSPYGGYSTRDVIYLLASKSIPMREIWKVQDEMYMAERYKLVYATKRPKPLLTGRFELRGIKKHLFTSAHARMLDEGPPFPPTVLGWPDADFIRKQKIVKVVIDESFVAQGERLTKEELLPYFKKVIDSTTLFYFKYDEAISFEDYLTLYRTYKQALFELRKEDELIRVDAYRIYLGAVNWNRYTEEQYYKDQDRLRKKYPARYVENYEFPLDVEETEN